VVSLGQRKLLPGARVGNATLMHGCWETSSSIFIFFLLLHLADLGFETTYLSPTIPTPTTIILYTKQPYQLTKNTLGPHLSDAVPVFRLFNISLRYDNNRPSETKMIFVGDLDDGFLFTHPSAVVGNFISVSSRHF
jgi:hypothetical protein